VVGHPNLPLVNLGTIVADGSVLNSTMTATGSSVENRGTLRSPRNGRLIANNLVNHGVIDLPGIRRMVEAAGFHGHQEVEIFLAENWWKRPGDEVLRTCVERYNTVC